MRFFYNLLAVAAVPIWFFNSFAGIIGFFWLLFGGNWHLSLAGLLAFFISSIVFGIAFLPQIGLTMLGIFFFDKNIKFLAWPIMYLATVCTMVVISYWVYYIYIYGLSAARGPISIIPVALWCYAVAVGPIQYMASKEPPGSIGTNLITIFTTIGGIWLFVAMVIFKINFFSAWPGFLLCMIICLNVMFYDVAKYEKFQTKMPSPTDKFRSRDVIEGETIMKEVKKPRKIKRKTSKKRDYLK